MTLKLYIFLKGSLSRKQTILEKFIKAFKHVENKN